MLRSLSSCAWLGSRDTGPSQTILPRGPRRLLYSSTRQEMQCCMTQGFPMFWSKILSSLPRNVVNSEGKVEQKKKRNQLVWKSRGCILIAVLTLFFGRTFDPRRETPGIGWWHRGKVWFGVPFPEEISETTHRDYQSDLGILVYCLHRSLRRYALILKIRVKCLDWKQSANFRF